MFPSQISFGFGGILWVHLAEPSCGTHRISRHLQDKILTSLNKKVQEVYFQCTGDNEANLPTVEMLKVIEKQLNDLLDSVERIPPAKIEKAVKDIRKEQRAR